MENKKAAITRGKLVMAFKTNLIIVANFKRNETKFSLLKYTVYSAIYRIRKAMNFFRKYPNRN